jgi:hypothetical protein
VAQAEAAQGQAPLRVKAKYLVGADGARGMVRAALGIEMAGATSTKRGFMGGKMFAVYLRAPAFYEVLPHQRAWMYVSFNSERRAFMATVDGKGEFAFHAAVHEGEDADAWTEEDARRVFAEAMGRELAIEVLSIGTWTAGHALYAEAMQRGRVFIGGDAAHLFTPTGGLGYNTAVEDAVNLGWKLAHVIKGLAPAALLESYESERKPLAMRNTGYARQFADSVGLFPARAELEEESAAGASARAQAAARLNAHVRFEFNIPGVTFGGRYDASPVIVKDGSTPPPDRPNDYQPSACPGGRPPHFWLPDGRSLYDAFNFEWTLLEMGAPREAARFREQAAGMALDLKVLAIDSAPLRALYEAPLALIRPDQMVAWRGGGFDPAVLRRVLGYAA